ncbi:MAG TPA: efflux RND transporter permease subunit, partial [Chroococcales cyanobacterium]
MSSQLFARILKQKIPIFLIVLMLALVGARLYGSIPQGVFPNVFFPRVMVTIENGYTPIKQMLLQTTRPAEETLKTVQGVEKITSGTSIGSVEINLFFDWKMDPHRAFQLVQSRVSEIKNNLPPDAKITVIQATPSRFPVAIYALGSDKLDREALTDRLYYHVKPILLSVKGIYDVEISAPQWQEYQVALDLEKLKTYHLSIDDVAKVLKDQNDIQFLGVIKDYRQQHIVSLFQKPEHIGDIENIRFPLGEKGSIALSDIALVIMGHSPINQMSAASGFQNSVLFNVIRQPDANSTDVVKEVDKQISGLNRQLVKEGLSIRKSYDETSFVDESIKSVQEAILLGTLIGALVVFLFLRKFKLSLFLVGIVPIVFLITLIGIHLIRFDFNIFSLGGMAAAIGGLIDHLIIVIENIERHYRESRDRWTAVVEGSIEILPVMTVATLLSVLIFLPLLLVSGVVGVFFKQLAFVLISTYVISQLLAVFFTPVIAYLALPKSPEEPKKDFLDLLVHRYAGFLEKALGRPWAAVPIVLVGFLALFLLNAHLPSTFLPKWDEGNLVVDMILPPGVSIDESYQEFLRAGKVILEVPEVECWSMRVGNGLGHPSVQPNEGDFLVSLKKKRTRSIFAITDDLRERISKQFANLEELDLPHVLEDRLGDILGEEAPISVQLYGTDPVKLIEWGGKVRDALRAVDGLEEVNLKTNNTSPSIDLKMKKEAESLYGIDKEALSAQINALYWGKVVGEVVQGEKVLGIRLIAQHPPEDPIHFLENRLTIFSPKFDSYV